MRLARPVNGCRPPRDSWRAAAGMFVRPPPRCSRIEFASNQVRDTQMLEILSFNVLESVSWLSVKVADVPVYCPSV